MIMALTQRDKFKLQLKTDANVTGTPIPPVPKLPPEFVAARSPEMQEALRAYDAQWDAFFKAQNTRNK